MTESRHDLLPPEDGPSHDGDRRLAVRQPLALSRPRAALGLLASALGTVILRRAAELLAEDFYRRLTQRTQARRARQGWRRRSAPQPRPLPADRIPVESAAANAPRAIPAYTIRRAVWTVRVFRRGDGVETIEAAAVEQVESRRG